MPEVKLLSNGNYHVSITPAGSGYSRWKGLAVTRWREDAALDHWGTFCYLRDNAGPHVWSTTLQPTLHRPGAIDRHFDAATATFLRRDHGIETRTEIAVSPDDDVELRRVRITNLSERRRRLSATSFAEIVLAAPGTDAAHPAFNKLFVETEIHPVLHAILATRRPSALDDPTPWFFHLALARDTSAAELSYETDRMRFIGRGRNPADPVALDSDAALSGSAGPVLDAVAAIRVPLTLEAGASLTIDWISGIAASRYDCTELARKYQDAQAAERILERAAAYRQATAQRLQASEAELQAYERIAAAILHADAGLRTDGRVIEENRRGQSGLWGFGISGDFPIVLLQISEPERLDLVRQLVQAHAFWRAFGIQSALVIISAEAVEATETGDREPALFDQVRQAVAASPGAEFVDKAAGIFVRDDAKLDDGDRILLQSVARVVVADSAGTLSEQLEQRSSSLVAARAAAAVAQTLDWPAAPDAESEPPPSPSRAPDDLLGGNGFGGFSADAREYVITASAARMTPAPWVNVIANPEFGTLVSESGSATTWSENAHEFRLTPWSNDPVTDPNTEAFYIRDEASGRFWSPTLLPTRCAAPYVVRHGFGYSVFEHTEDGIESELRVFVALDAPVKFSALTLRNRSAQRRAAVGHRLPRMGARRRAREDADAGGDRARQRDRRAVRAQCLQHRLRRTHRVLRCRRRDPHRRRRPRATSSAQCGSLAAPAALARAELSGRVGAALDPCAALRVALELAPGEAREVVFRLGAGKTDDEARALVRAGAAPRPRSARSPRCERYWQQTLGSLQVRTPGPHAERAGQRLAALPGDRVAAVGPHGVLPVERRVRLSRPAAGRDGAGPRRARAGARAPAARGVAPVPRGRRAALVASAVGQGRAHALLRRLPVAAAARPAATSRRPATAACSTSPAPSSRAGRCRTAKPRTTTCRRSRSSRAPSTSTACARSATACASAQHGLPLMGCGDWNDGMNLVGAGGKGESVWLAFFLIAVLTQFAPLARRHANAGVRRTLRHRGGAAAPAHRGNELGRRLVPPRLLRRRRAARLGQQRRMPDRFDRAELGGAVGRRATRSAPTARWPRSTAAWCTATRG